LPRDSGAEIEERWVVSTRKRLYIHVVSLIALVCLSDLAVAGETVCKLGTLPFGGGSAGGPTCSGPAFVATAAELEAHERNCAASVSLLGTAAKVSVKTSTDLLAKRMLPLEVELDELQRLVAALSARVATLEGRTESIASASVSGATESKTIHLDKP
jgi:hypothetical protein